MTEFDRLSAMAEEAASYVQRLKAFYTEDEARLWMVTRHDAFGCSPADMIVVGKGSEVAAEINRLETGAFS